MRSCSFHMFSRNNAEFSNGCFENYAVLRILKVAFISFSRKVTQSIFMGVFGFKASTQCQEHCCTIVGADSAATLSRIV